MEPMVANLLLAAAFPEKNQAGIRKRWIQCIYRADDGFEQ
jgi:hypothetical protein